MYLHKQPDTLEKMTQMGDLTLFESAGDAPLQEKNRFQSRNLADCITQVQTPKGAKPILRTMITTACERNCFYCPFRAGHSGTKRVTIQPDELASAFDAMQRAKTVDGLFLSSGIIKGGVTTQDKILDTADILRKKYQYRGYVHLKIMPSAEEAQIERAMQLADRISINLEAPTPERLASLAPKKDFNGELLHALQIAHKLKLANPRLRASLVTQFVVGAVGDTDLELLGLSQKLYQQLGVSRAYYSAFHPIQGTPFENLSATADIRERRLYQASFLLRDYAWDLEDLPFLDSANLRTDIDPKLAWAESHLIHQPIDIMQADRQQLLRLPNVGVKGVEAILKARQQGKLEDFGQLSRLGIRAAESLAPFVLFNGKRPLQQKTLF